MHSPQSTNLAFHYEIRWHRRACHDRLNRWLLRPTKDTVSRDQPARKHHKGLICRGPLPSIGASGQRSEYGIKPTLGPPLLIFPRGYLLKFHDGIPPQDSGGLKSEFTISYVSCQRLSCLTCQFYSYTAGN